MIVIREFVILTDVTFVIRLGMTFMIRLGVTFVIRLGVSFVIRLGVAFVIRLGVPDRGRAGEGVLSIEYLGQTFKGDLLGVGKIHSQETGLVFSNPSTWAIY